MGPIKMATITELSQVLSVILVDWGYSAYAIPNHSAETAYFYSIDFVLIRIPVVHERDWIHGTYYLNEFENTQQSEKNTFSKHASFLAH